MTITPTTLFRAAGLAAVAAGLIFIGVQINHPHSDVASVTCDCGPRSTASAARRATETVPVVL